jgi:hypothetical protein
MVSLENLGRGAALEKFEDALKAVIADVLDENTTLAARTITLKVTVKPDENRDLCKVGIDCKAGLAPRRPFVTNIFVGMQAGQPVATEHNPNQPPLPGMDRSKVVGINREGDKE